MGEARGFKNPLAPRVGGERRVDEMQRARALRNSPWCKPASSQEVGMSSGALGKIDLGILRTGENGGSTGEVRGSADSVVPRREGESGGAMCLAELQREKIHPELIESVMKTAVSIFSSQDSLSYDSLTNLIIEAIASTDGNFGVLEAVQWANGYEFPQELVDSDLRLFRASQLDFNRMVERRYKKLGLDRLSQARVSRLREDNPERERLLDIAQGMRVSLPAGFTPNGKSLLTPLRPAYLEVHQAVDKMLAELHTQGLAFCLPKKEAIDLIDGLHLGKASWTPKKGKASGRSIGDMSFCDGTPLNCDESKVIAESWWGEDRTPDDRRCGSDGTRVLRIGASTGTIDEMRGPAALENRSQGGLPTTFAAPRMCQILRHGNIKAENLHPFTRHLWLDVHSSSLSSRVTWNSVGAEASPEGTM